MSADLATRIAAKSAERRALAEAALTGDPPEALPWIVERQNGTLFEVYVEHHGYEVATNLQQANAVLIAANDPADTIRRCDHADKVLARHHTVTYGNSTELCASCRLVPWPCPDLLNLAEMWGVTP